MSPLNRNNFQKTKGGHKLLDIEVAYFWVFDSKLDIPLHDVTDIWQYLDYIPELKYWYACGRKNLVLVPMYSIFGREKERYSYLLLSTGIHIMDVLIMIDGALQRVISSNDEHIAICKDQAWLSKRAGNEIISFKVLIVLE